MKIEIICWEDTTWTTEVIDIPEGVTFGDDFVFTHLWGRRKYRKAVYIGIYNEDPEDEEN